MVLTGAFWQRWRSMGLYVLTVTLICASLAQAISTGRQQRVEQAMVEAQTREVALPILMYHSILEDKSRLGRYVVSPTELESDLQYIRERGYTTVVMADLIRYVEEGVPLPEKPIMLTFDDGQYNNYLYAYPLLRRYAMKAVLSPVVKWSEEYSAMPKEQNRAAYSYLTWEQLWEMAESGVVEIQNHSYAMHDNSTGKRKGITKRAGETVESYQRVLEGDLQKAQTLLTEKGIPIPTTLTYPFGAMCPEALPIIEKLGFRATLSCESRVNRITRDEACLMDLGRYLRPSGKSSAQILEPIFALAEGM